MIKKIQIPISKPNLTKEDFLEIKKCFDSTWISSKSPWIEKFENAFAKRVSQTTYAVTVNSGTSALFLALKALGVGQGDEVIIPSLTMIATINAIILAGARPVLVGSKSEDDWNIDPEKIAKKITSRTKVIMPVHLYGYPCDMDEINRIAKKNKLYVVEDAAEAMGSSYKTKAVGSLSDISCFSLYTNKIITTANGGVICTNNKHLAELLRKLRFFDYNPEIHFKHKIIGYNMVLSGLQGALGYSQIKRFAKRLKRRRQIYFWYKQMLGGEKVRFLEPLKNSLPNYWFPAVVLQNETVKKRVAAALEKKSIESREFFLPMHLQPVYKDTFVGENYSIAEYFYQRGLLLPSYYELTAEQVEHVCSVIKTALN